MALLLSGVAGPGALASEPAAAAGRQRAAASRLVWDVRDARHPSLGNIRYAFMKILLETPVGNRKVYSRAYVSCEKAAGRIAIELTNTTAPDDPSGLRPFAVPRLLCSRPAADGKLAQQDLMAAFAVDPGTGDALTRGLRPGALRECAAIGVVQEVALPAGWGRPSARVEFEIPSYGRELDSIFVTCGERSAYADAPADRPVAPAPVAAAPARAAPPAVTPAATPKAPETQAPPPWRTVRVIFGGRTNVRAGPDLQSAIVTQLAPGAPVLVQKTDTEWWRARGQGFEGYIRQDRLQLR